eukprot:6720923-Lingulodinium_polyedra.AAC.1
MVQLQRQRTDEERGARDPLRHAGVPLAAALRQDERELGASVVSPVAPGAIRLTHAVSNCLLVGALHWPDPRGRAPAKRDAQGCGNLSRAKFAAERRAALHVKPA